MGLGLDGWLSAGQFDRSRVFFCLDGGGEPEVVAEEQVEGLGQLARDGVLVVDKQAFEEREIELAAYGVRGLAVGGFAVTDERERPVEVRLGRFEVGFDFGEASFGGGYPGGDAGLLGLEQVERDGVGVVGVKQLFTLGFQLGPSAGLGGSFVVGVGPERG